MKGRGLFLICGEAFREGVTNTRLRDTEYGYNNQKESSLSQNKLIEKLTNDGWIIDVGLHTYKTIFENELLGWYKNIVFSSFNDFEEIVSELIHNISRIPIGKAFNSLVKNVNLNDYDFLFILRFDIFLKEGLIEIFDPNWSRIMYINAMSYWENTNLPHISDPFVFIPKSFFFEKNDWKGLIPNSDRLLYHSAAAYLIRNCGISINDIGFMIKRTYPTNTQQEENPYFRLNGRSEGPVLTNYMLYDEEKQEFTRP